MNVAAIPSLLARRSIVIPLVVAGLVGAVFWWFLPPPPRAVLAGIEAGPSRYISVMFAPDGRSVATWEQALDDNQGVRLLRLWNVADGQPRVTLYQGQRQLYSLAFAPDGRHVAARWFDRGITVWDRSDGRSMGEYRHPGWKEWNPHLQIVYSPDNRLLAYGPAPHAGPRSGALWDVATAEPVHLLFGDDEGYRPVVSQQDGFVVTWRDGRLKVWHLATATVRGTFAVSELAGGFLPSFGPVTPDGRTCAGHVGPLLGQRLHLWHAVTGADEDVPLAADSMIPALAPDAAAVAVSLPEPPADRSPVIAWLVWLSGNRFDPNTRYPMVRIIDVAHSRVLADFDHADRANFAPDGRTLAVASPQDGMVCLYDWPLGRPWGQIVTGAALTAAAVVACQALLAAWRRRRPRATASRNTGMPTRLATPL
jgi:WD40 repeat protein